jgi:hypothetical protein
LAAMTLTIPFSLIRMLALALACSAVSSTAVAAESALKIPYPATFGLTPAATFDEAGERVGAASLEVSLLDSGNVALKLLSGYDGGARIVLKAELAPQGSLERRTLRILRESSQSYNAVGEPLVLLAIDHEKGTASCIPPEDSGRKISTIELPSPDRVVNVPLNLLFRPLGTGDVDTIDTQAFFCLGGARIMGFTGKLKEERPHPSDDGRRILEVGYAPDGKGFLSWAAKAVAPPISFWMDVNHNGAYIAHKMPLYSKGPIVYVVADGVDTEWLISP